MDSQQIRLSALGRDVKVGDLYNYYNDFIFPSYVNVPQECLSVDKKSIPKTEWIYLPQLEHLKYDALGISAHLRNSIENNFVDLSQLWFANFLESSQLKDDTVAHVSFLFRLVRGTENLNPCFFYSKLNEYQLSSGGRATHVVEKVVYGAELLCSMQRPINRKCEKKQNAEGNLYLVAMEYFNQIFRHSANPYLPAALQNVECEIFSSLDAGNQLQGSCLEAVNYLRDALSFKDDRAKMWKPIEVTLRNIPGQFQALLRLEKKFHVQFGWERQEATWKLIRSKCQNIMSHPAFNFVPSFTNMMYQFYNLLIPLMEEIDKFYNIFQTSCPEQVLKEKEISNLLSDMIDWLFHRRFEIGRFCCLLKDSQLILNDWAEIETSNIPNQTILFVMQAQQIPNVVVESIQKFIGTASAPVVPLLAIPLLFADKELLVITREKMPTIFPDEDQSNYSDQNQPCISYHVRQPSEYFPWNGCLTTTIENYKKMLTGYTHTNSPMKQQQDENKPEIKFQPTAEGEQLLDLEMNSPATMDHQSSAEQRDSSMQLNHTVLFVTSSEFSTGTRTVRHLPLNSPPEVNPAKGLLNQKEAKGRRVEEEETRSETLVDCDLNLCCVGEKLDENENCINKESTDEAGNQSVQYWASSTSITYRHEISHHQTTTEMDCAIEIPSPDCTENVQLNNQRIAEFFADKKNHYATLIKQGHPNIYLLNATETSIGDNLRWFDIGQPNNSPPSAPTGFRNHKVIILMGATGCGKSTLINGMVNYILGVKWKDPFRFKCVREDDTVAQNQAISQTSSVTAYAIHHHDGMAVPYTITIIDTPGYGDTRGVKRDKEITLNIHQFLCQHETRVDEIHAACFVAASGDSRLTTTQRYIIDSALSIFGKDVKENIRLLVTFADNADPPAVEACRAANFPLTSTSAGITYSKFNSSVLYANNQQSGEDDFCFDELFWDMGQENFSKFFTMLEGMSGQNLQSTREVIERRSVLEKSLKYIEQELEVCLFNIENMEKFQRKMKECGHKMETSKHFVIENMKVSYSREPCENGFYAYNCKTCQRTCEHHIPCGNLKKLRKNKKQCSHLACIHSPDEHDYEDFEIRQTPVKGKKTLLDLKAKYKSNADEKAANEQLLADCSYKLDIAKAKVFSLLHQVGENVRLLESTALRSNTLSPSDYLSLMKSRVAEEQAAGYQIRLETLSELQKSLDDNKVATTQQAAALGHSQPTFQHGSQSTRGSRGRGFNGCEWNSSTQYHDEMEDFSQLPRRHPTNGPKQNNCYQHH